MIKKIYLLIVFCLLFYCRKSEEICFYVTGGPLIDRTHHYPADTIIAYDSTLTLKLLSDPVYDSIAVRINGEPVYHGYIIAEDNSLSIKMPISTDSIAYELEVESDLGCISAVCTMPGMFAISSPPVLYIEPAVDCSIHWEKATYAQWYAVALSYFDTLQPPEHTWDTTCLFTDTATVIVPHGQIFHYGTIMVKIDAGNGPSLLPGDEGNVEGNAKGYWVARSRTCRAIKVGWW